jgi:hypothetical protein
MKPIRRQIQQVDALSDLIPIRRLADSFRIERSRWRGS